MHKVVREFYHDSLKSKETGAIKKNSQFCQLGKKCKKKMVVSCSSNELNANEMIEGNSTGNFTDFLSIKQNKKNELQYTLTST